MKSIFRPAIGLLVACGTLMFPISCSGNGEDQGRIEKMTQEAGKDLADKFTAPIDKAKAVKAQQEKRDRDSAGRIPEE